MEAQTQWKKRLSIRDSTNEPIINDSFSRKNFIIYEVRGTDYGYQWANDYSMDTALASGAKAKAKSDEWVKTHPYSIPEEYVYASELPGNYDLYSIITKNLKYPERSLIYEKQAIVFIQFVVGVDGSIRDVRLNKGLVKDHGCNEEALRVCKLLTNFKPGRVNGKAIEYTCFLPVEFNIREYKSNQRK